MTRHPATAARRIAGARRLAALALAWALPLAGQALAEDSPAGGAEAPAAESAAAPAPPNPVQAANDLRNFHRAPADAGWLVHVSMPGWLPAMDGTVMAGGQASPTYLGLDDTLELMKKHLDMGALLNVQARRGRWSLFADVLYLKLSGSFDKSAELPPLATGRPEGLTRHLPRRVIRDYLDPSATIGVEGDFSFSQTVLEFGAGYRFLDLPYGENAKKRLSLDLIGGLRYWRLETGVHADFDLSATVNTPGGPVTRSRKAGIHPEVTKDWADPFIGLQAQADLTEKLFLYARGDVGGFGLGSAFSSQFTWKAQAGLSYNLTPRMGLFAGYQVLDVDYEDGGFGFDMWSGGPVLGFTYTFGGPRPAAGK